MTETCPDSPASPLSPLNTPTTPLDVEEPKRFETLYLGYIRVEKEKGWCSFICLFLFVSSFRITF